MSANQQYLLRRASELDALAAAASSGKVRTNYKTLANMYRTMASRTVDAGRDNLAVEQLAERIVGWAP